MKIYSVDTFTEDGITVEVDKLKLGLETVEYAYNYLLDQITAIKKKNFKELLTYETMKKSNPNLPPDLIVLNQMKTLERDQAFSAHKKTLTNFEEEIRIIKAKIDKCLECAKANFSFTVENHNKYVGLYTELAENPSESKIAFLMMEIFNIELNNRLMYFDVRWTRMYSIIELLIEKAPLEQKQLYINIFNVIKYADNAFDYNFFKEYPEFLPKNYKYSIVELSFEYDRVFNQQLHLWGR
ncbi:MAG: hypothetical protein DRH57_07650 [Candidatus Cloacimonadota bacterium]|nr:MAG: hypothetical protein DRH57_07650 [Candidatus Cloacimonadota bacterium]